MKNKINTDESNIKHYNETGELYGKKIECNHCNALITCFGSNLEGKIEKFKTIENLLGTFVCRKCNSALKPAKPVKVKKVRKIKLHKKINEEGEIVYDIPKMKFSTPRNVFLKDAPDLIEGLTKFSCAAPQLFLDNARNCNGCAFWSNCQCPIKTANEFATVA
jgi:hypothetical protein